MVSTLALSAFDLGLAAQRRASDPEVSAWVSANAGTGKTRVLTDRIARLLLAGSDPQRLLCLTFTKAAAAEMQERLFARLGHWATLADEELREELRRLGVQSVEGSLPTARRLFARALEIPGGLRIQTIHAFCEGLLKRFPLEAQVAPHFQVLDEGAAAELLAFARDRVLRSVQEDGAGGGSPGSASAAWMRAGGCRLAAALALISEVEQERGFHKLMAELAGKRSWIQRLRLRHGGTEGLIESVRALLDVAPDLTSAGVLAEGCAEPALPLADLIRAVEVLSEGGGPRDRKLAAWLQGFLDGPDRAALFAAYEQSFLTKTGKPRKNLASKRALALDPALGDVLRAEQARVLRVSAQRRAAFVAQATEAALLLGGVLLDAYEAEKRRRAALDYDDLILETRRLLRERADAAWVLSKLDANIDHVLLDEAQDTSPEQWDVVQALTEEFFAGLGAQPGIRTVFAVGDEKQSIYAFQGADPHAFGHMRAYFAEQVRSARLGWRPEELALSFRSTPEVLRAVDLVFDEQRARSGLSVGNAPIRHTAFRHGDEGVVEIWPTVRPASRSEIDPWNAPLDRSGTAGPPARLARRIADTIEFWLREGEILTPRGRTIRPGDILILVRRRNAFVDEMVRALKQKRIPVAGADRLILTEQMAVKDLIALGRFALLPGDDLTLATVLRGPLIGLTEKELFDLAHDRPGSLWTALTLGAEGGAAHLPRAYAMLTDAIARAGELRPFEFYSELLGRLEGRRRLLTRLGPEAGDPIDEFLALALRFERMEAPSLEGFLRWVEAAGAEAKRDHEHGRDEVRIMTVHGAKGLEANIVFLADTCSMPTARHDPMLVPAGPDGSFLLWPVRKAYDTAECEAGRDGARRARDEEYRRLLYVAMTRARDRLYVCGYETYRPLPRGSWYELIAGALRPACAEVELPFGETGWRFVGKQQNPPMDDLTSRPAPIEAAAPPAWANKKPTGEATSVLLGTSGAERPPLGAPLDVLFPLLPDVRPELREETARRYLAAHARWLDPDERERMIAAVLSILSDPDFAPVFAPGSRADITLAGILPDLGRDSSGLVRVDRLAVGPFIVLALNYALGSAPRLTEDWDAALVRRMAAGQAALRALYPDRPIRCAILWTDKARLVALPESCLDASLSNARGIAGP